MDNFVKLNLKVEQDLSEEEIEKIKSTADFAKIYNNLLRFASLRPRSEKEIRLWFKRKKVPESFYEKLFGKLARLEMVGDEKFAKWWIDSRIQFKSKSKKELVFELRNKGIDQNIIEDVLSETEFDEVKTAKELLKNKAYKWQKLPSKEKRKKKTEFLGRRGFGWEVIKKVINLTDAVE